MADIFNINFHKEINVKITDIATGKSDGWSITHLNVTDTFFTIIASGTWKSFDLKEYKISSYEIRGLISKSLFSD